MEYLQIGLFIFNLLIAIIVALIGFQVKSIMRRIETLEGEMKAVKTNYLNRFTAVLENQAAVKEELSEQQHLVKEELVKQQTTVKEELMAQNSATEKTLLEAIHNITLELVKHESGAFNKPNN
jgi:formate dehydrogenase maturation protein FdhE